MSLQFEHLEHGRYEIFDDGGCKHVEGFVIRDKDRLILDLHC